MRPLELENWATKIADRVAQGQPIEDSRVELKAQWPADSLKAARQLAAHANSSRGEPILWLIGIDEKLGVVGADFAELTNWMNEVYGKFDENVVPHLLCSLNASIQSKTVAALYFETDRLPYIVTTGDRRYHREVPWRSATGLRSAHRSDLVRILLPTALVPTAHLVSAKLECLSGAGKTVWGLSGVIYLVTKRETRASIPHHWCSGSFRDSTSSVETQFGSVSFEPRDNAKRHSLSPITSDDGQLIIQGSGLAQFSAHLEETQRTTGYPHIAAVEIRGPIAEADWHPLVVKMELYPLPRNRPDAIHWALRPGEFPM